MNGEVVALGRPQSARAIRRRLLNPVNGHDSSELDIVADAVMRRARIEQALREKNLEHAARRQRAIELVDRYLQAIGQWVVNIDDSPEPEGIVPNAISTSQIIAVICDFYSVHRDTLRANNRTATVARARQVAMYLMREHTPLSFSQIGLKFGGRDHSTVVHSHQKITTMLAHGEEDLAANIAGLRQLLGVASPRVADQSGAGS